MSMTKRGGWWVGRTATMRVSVTNNLYEYGPLPDPTKPQAWVDAFYPDVAQQGNDQVSYTFNKEGQKPGRLVIRPLTKKECQDAADYDNFVEWVKAFDLAFYGERAEA